MLKTFKRVISTVLIAAFILSLVPVVGMAEMQTDINVSIVEDRVVRFYNGTLATTSGTHGFRIDSQRNAYMKIDLSAYADHLKKPSTKINFKWETLHASGPCFSMYILPASVETVNLSTMIYDDVTNNNMANFSEFPLVLEYDNSSIGNATAPSSVAFDMSVINSELAKDPGNYILTIGATNTTMSEQSEICIKNFSVTISYDPDEEVETDESYVNRAIEEYSWSDLFGDVSESFVASGTELPSVKGDINILWSANPSTVLDNNIVAIPGIERVSAKFTATFSRGGYSTSKDYPATIFYNLIDINNGSTLPDHNSGDSHYGLVIENNGIGGKIIGDSYINVIDESANPYMRETVGTDVTAYEFAMFLGEECSDNGINVTASIYEDSESETTGAVSLRFKKSGITKVIASKEYPVIAMPIGEWVNFALVSPKGQINETECDNTWELYMNGELILEQAVATCQVPGFGYIRIHGSSTDQDGTGIFNSSGYLDNLRVIRSPNYYLSEIDTPFVPAMTTYNLDSIGKTISVASDETTVANILNNMVLDDYTTVRVFDETDTPIEDNSVPVEDGFKFVLATTNGTFIERAYSYYTIRMVNGKTAFDAPVISIDTKNNKATAYVKAFNYTENPVNYKLYLAVYEDNTLVTVRPAELSATNGTATAINDLEAEILEGQSAKLFVWEDESIGIKPILLAKEVSR